MAVIRVENKSIIADAWIQKQTDARIKGEENIRIKRQEVFRFKSLKELRKYPHTILLYRLLWLLLCSDWIKIEWLYISWQKLYKRSSREDYGKRVKRSRGARFRNCSSDIKQNHRNGIGCLHDKSIFTRSSVDKPVSMGCMKSSANVLIAISEV